MFRFRIFQIFRICTLRSGNPYRWKFLFCEPFRSAGNVSRESDFGDIPELEEIEQPFEMEDENENVMENLDFETLQSLPKIKRFEIKRRNDLSKKTAEELYKMITNYDRDINELEIQLNKIEHTYKGTL